MGLHTGEPVLTDEGYVGLDVHIGARIAACAHGGQIVLSRRTSGLAGDEFFFRDLGEHRLKDLAEPVWVFQLGERKPPSSREFSESTRHLRLARTCQKASHARCVARTRNVSEMCLGCRLGARRRRQKQEMAVDDRLRDVDHLPAVVL
jgi:hypothetical protein